MDVYSLSQVFVNAIVTTLGAFVPIFFLMYVHYWIRKISYRGTKTRLLKAREVYQKLVDINDEVIHKIYASAKITSFQELLDNPKDLAHLDKFQYARMVSYVNEQLDQKIKSLDRMNKMMLDMMYIDGYSFGTYLGTLLDKRFPDKNFK